MNKNEDSAFEEPEVGNLCWRCAERFSMLFTWLLCFSVVVIGLESSCFAQQRSDDKPIDFIRQVQPVLAKRCFACHGPDEAEGGLRFSDQASAMVEAESGVHAIVAGDVEASELIARISTDDEHERMPPEGDPLSAPEISVLTSWIQQGAKWDKHWAFKPMNAITPPSQENATWSQHPIDAFIFRSLVNSGLKPNLPANRAALIRRVYYDLTGLPPSFEQMEAFVRSTDPQAYEKLIDRLLQSDHYGERWGRHWLDLVRFAETNSFERDGPKPNAWKYRDFVIKSFNDDKPYSQFLREQIAGDELDAVTTETLTATGYYRLGIWDDEPADPLQAKFDEIDDIITTTGQAMLGLTINCARCHDHKIDPISQKDYYGMVALLGDVTSWGTRGDQRTNSQIDVTDDGLKDRYVKNDKQRRRIEKQTRELEQLGIAKMSGPDQRASEVSPQDRKRVLDEKLMDYLSDPQRSAYESLRKKLSSAVKAQNDLPPRQMVMGLAKSNAKPEQTFVLFRGNPHSPADPVEPAFPGIFNTAAPTDFKASQKTAGRRRVLADWIASPDNRLTARVMANRIWQFHFGRGIVRSSNNFGQLGTPPTHPELLDWLGHQLIQGDWKLKRMHRLIMTSQAYRMSTAAQAAGMSIDPENDLFWRFDPRRLSAEEVRDSILAVNGSLNRKFYGPSIYPKLSKEVLAGQSRPGDGWGKSSDQDRNRRSVYIYVKRSLITPLLTAFDFPDPDLTCEDRFVTLQPGQALSLMNGRFIHEQALRLAQSIEFANVDDAEVVRKTIQATLSRVASEAEIAEGSALIKELQNQDGMKRKRAVQLYCLTVMNWNEFLFLH